MIEQIFCNDMTKTTIGKGYCLDVCAHQRNGNPRFREAFLCDYQPSQTNIDANAFRKTLRSFH